MNVDLIKAMIARRAADAREKARKLSVDATFIAAQFGFRQIAFAMDSLLKDINSYDKAKAETPSNDMTWEQWQRATTDHLGERLEISNGDAQAIVEAREKLSIQLWHANYSPAQAAIAIDKDSTATIS